MKGIVFTLLQEFVEGKFGYEAWNAILEKAETSSKGIFVATETYPDSDLFNIAEVAVDLTKLDLKTVLEAFGEFSFPQLIKSHPTFLKEGMDLKDFLKSVDSVIHVEVRKLNPDASLPQINYDNDNPGKLSMLYTSERKLCHFGVGLIKGAANYLNEQVEITHPKCMHEGCDHCQLDLTFKKAG